MSNYDKIRSMSVAEMAEYIFDLSNACEYCYGHCAYQDDEKCPQDGGKKCLEGVRIWLEREED